MVIQDYGDPIRPIWAIISKPYDKDSENGYIFSSGYGYNFKKTWNLANLSYDDLHITSVMPCLGSNYANPDANYAMLLSKIENFKPPIIIPLDDACLNYLVPRTKQIKEKNSSLRKWAGSLLQSDYLKYPHYVIGTHDPQWVTVNWKYHEIQGFIDFGHVKEEFDYFKRTGTVQALPHRTLITEPVYDTLVDYLRWLLVQYDRHVLSYVSTDIETIRPKKGSFYNIFHNPGYPYTISLAPSSKEAISFSYWDYTPEQCVNIWRLLNDITTKIPQIGQNFFTFDSHYKEGLGFSFNYSQIHDTLIRHHILWPGLEHKLQFQTKQYTREPYYKDEGKNWNSKMKRQLMVYNAKDAAVTFEIFEAQELEFIERPHLR